MSSAKKTSNDYKSLFEGFWDFDRIMAVAQMLKTVIRECFCSINF
jgi:hypothetical protein